MCQANYIPLSAHHNTE